MKQSLALFYFTLLFSLTGCGGETTESLSGKQAPANTAVNNFPDFKPYTYSNLSNSDVSKDSLEGTWLIIGEGETKDSLYPSKFYTRALIRIFKDENGSLMQGDCFVSLPSIISSLNKPSIEGINFNIIDNSYMTSITDDHPHSNFKSWNFTAIKVLNDSETGLIVEELEIERDNTSESILYGNCVKETLTKFKDSGNIEYKLQVEGETQISSESREFSFTFNLEKKSITTNKIEVFHSSTGETTLFWPTLSDSDFLTFETSNSEKEMSLTTILKSDGNGDFRSSISSIKLP